MYESCVNYNNSQSSFALNTAGTQVVIISAAVGALVLLTLISKTIVNIIYSYIHMNLFSVTSVLVLLVLLSGIL